MKEKHRVIRGYQTGCSSRQEMGSYPEKGESDSGAGIQGLIGSQQVGKGSMLARRSTEGGLLVVRISCSFVHSFILPTNIDQAPALGQALFLALGIQDQGARLKFLAFVSFSVGAKQILKLGA